MATRIASIPVAPSGTGSPIYIGDLVGPKTVVLSGRFQGSYTLLATHVSGFAPVLLFNSDGQEQIVLTLPEAYAAVQLRTNANTTGTVTCSISGVSVPGQNTFGSFPPVLAGASGPQPSIDTFVLVPPTGFEADINVICSATLVTGTILVEGSNDNINFNTIGSFSGGAVQRALVGYPAMLEFSPLASKDLVRYLRINVQGHLVSPALFSVGGGVPATGGGPSGIAMPLSIGPTILNPTSNVVGLGVLTTPLAGAIGLESFCAGHLSSAIGDYSVVVGYLSTANGPYDFVGGEGNTSGPQGYSVVIGQGSAGGNSLAVIVIGRGITNQDNSSSVVVIGDLSSNGTNSDNATILGRQANGGDSSGQSVAVGFQASVASNSSNSTSIGSTTSVSGTGATAVGYNTHVTGNDTVALGSSSIVLGDTCVSLGIVANTHSNDAISIGHTSGVGTSSEGSISIGHGSFTGSASTGDVANSIAIGTTANTSGTNAIAIGNSTVALADSSLALGDSAQATGVRGIAIGNGALANVSTTDAISIGTGATNNASVISPISIGTAAVVAANTGIALGSGASCGYEDSMVFGRNANDVRAGEVVFGGVVAAAHINLFHAFCETSNPNELFRFDENHIVNNYDSAFFLRYKDHTGTVLLAPVTVDSVTGFLHVTP